MDSNDAHILSHYLRQKQSQWADTMRAQRLPETVSEAQLVQDYVLQRKTIGLAHEFTQDNAFVTQKICAIIARRDAPPIIKAAIDMGAYALDPSGPLGPAAQLVLNGLYVACRSRTSRPWVPLIVVAGLLGLIGYGVTRRRS
jgi:hypothetical protein